MKEINKQTLKTASQKLFFDMTEEEYDTLLVEFNTILEQMELISQIDNLEKLEPMVFPYEIFTSFLREDAVKDTLSKEEVLKNASDVVEGQIRLPKVVG